MRIFYAAAGGICPQSRMGYGPWARHYLKLAVAGALALVLCQGAELILVGAQAQHVL